jgi:hypothetical protein
MTELPNLDYYGDEKRQKPKRREDMRRRQCALGIRTIRALTYVYNMTGDTAQSSNLLLDFASTVILGFGPHRDPRSHFRLFQDHTCGLKWGPPLRREEGLNTTSVTA